MTPTLLFRLPLWVSRWLGYRQEPKAAPGFAVICFWSFLGAFCSLAVLQAVFGHTQYFISRHTPAVVASFVSKSQIKEKEKKGGPQLTHDVPRERVPSSVLARSTHLSHSRAVS